MVKFPRAMDHPDIVSVLKSGESIRVGITKNNVCVAWPVEVHGVWHIHCDSRKFVLDRAEYTPAKKERKFIFRGHFED